MKRNKVPPRGNTREPPRGNAREPPRGDTRETPRGKTRRTSIACCCVLSVSFQYYADVFVCLRQCTGGLQRTQKDILAAGWE